MPERALKPCKEPGCTIWTRERYCETHAKNNQVGRLRYIADRKRHLDPIFKLYNCAAWHRCTTAFLSCNPGCMRIGPEGKQCHEAATICHHLISPRVRQDLMYSFSNLKALCEAHHEPTEGERPENLDKLSEIYVATKFPKWMGRT
jgi:5-methylcytosine-specific restriction enzyme A